MLSCAGVGAAAQPFLAALLHQRFPRRPIVLVLEGVRPQETCPAGPRHLARGSNGRVPKPATALFYPAWEILPARSPAAACRCHQRAPGNPRRPVAIPSPAIPTSNLPSSSPAVAALLQRTFPRPALQTRTRTVARGDRLDPLDLVEWLEAQGYEPEAQVTQKGELALRGGILDVFPLTRPWPVRLEFSATNWSRCAIRSADADFARGNRRGHAPAGGRIGAAEEVREVAEVRSPKAGRLGDAAGLSAGGDASCCSASRSAGGARRGIRAAGSAGDPFFISWPEPFRRQAAATRGCEATVESSTGGEPRAAPRRRAAGEHLPRRSSKAWKPTARCRSGRRSRQWRRRSAASSFGQLHRWLRQGYAVHVFCNNDGERQRFDEIWEEYGLSGSPQPDDAARGQPRRELGLCALHSGHAGARVSLRRGQAGGGHRRRNLRALQGAAAAPAEIARTRRPRGPPWT